MPTALRSADTVIGSALRRFLDGGAPTSLLVTGAAGMGKTSLLFAAAQQAIEVPSACVVAMSGSIVASEGQCFRALAAAANVSLVEHRRWEDTASRLFEALRKRAADRDERILLMIDDFDRLAFKRERLLDALATELRRAPHLMLLVTAARATVERIVGSGRPFANLLEVVMLTPMSERAARELVQLRAPALRSEVVDVVVAQAGGHPGALVFVSRIAELLACGGHRIGIDDLLNRAGELAGAVYAEPWSALGPQQRAILWHVSAAPGATQTVTDLADRLFLHSSHVSAQLTRLREEGLVTRVGGRGEYGVAPLLARWILEHAVRWTERPDPDISHSKELI